MYREIRRKREKAKQEKWLKQSIEMINARAVIIECERHVHQAEYMKLYKEALGKRGL